MYVTAPLAMADSDPKDDGGQAASRLDRRLPWLALLLVTACVLRAAQMAWLSDDAFISFRYARNLHDGLGLVYNAGEYVEGYTNLLWTLAMAATLQLGGSMEFMSQALGILCWLGLSVALAAWSWQRSRATGRALLPLAALLNLLLEDSQRWASGGLETSLFNLLCVGGLLLLVAGHARRRWQLGAGLVLSLACLTRPDGAIFAALGVAYPLCRRAPWTDRLRDSACVALPLVLIGTALVIFKLRYYGDLFPTAFYAKSALDAYYRQGLSYVWLFFARNWFVLAFVPLALWWARARLACLATPANGLWLAALLSFGYYVVHSAGDFMYARRLLPALPFLWLLCEELLALTPTRRVACALFFATLLAAAVPRPLYGNTPGFIDGITNEWAHYPPAVIAMARARGEQVGAILAGSPVRAAYEGGLAMFAHYSGLPYLVEMTGLTQYSLAKQTLTERGRIGHEKSADPRWLTDNHIHLLFFHDAQPLRSDGRRRFDLIGFSTGVTAKIWRYSDAVMDPLRGHADVDFVPIETVLAQAERDILRAAPAEARTILQFLERYYLSDAAPGRAAQVGHLRQLVADKTRNP